MKNNQTTIKIISKLSATNKAELPIVENIPAGFPTSTHDYTDQTLDLNKYLIKNKNATYFVKVEGNSMEGAGIYNGDILIVDRSLLPEHNKIVIAAINGEFTVKRIKKIKDKFYLVPENEDYKPIALNENDDIFIWGVVTYSIHRLY